MHQTKVLRMADGKKLQILRARVPPHMKSAINAIADKRGETESVIVREALTMYLNAHSRRRVREQQQRRRELESEKDA